MTETPTPYGNPPQSDFESQYKRILEAVECRTQTQLAAVLEIKQSSISDAKRRKSVPSEWLMKLFEKKRINPDWIRSGLGDRIFRAAASAASADAPQGVVPPVIQVIERRPAEECGTDELLAELLRRAVKASG